MDTWEEGEYLYQITSQDKRLARLIRALNTVMDAYAGEYGGKHMGWTADDLDWLDLEPGDVAMPEDGE